VIAPYAEPSRDKLLPDHPPQLKGREKPTLVISLDGTLIECLWTRQYGWRYIKRPGVDEFLASLAPHWELVLWTESLSTADQVVDMLDPRRLFRHRLYRDATTYTGGLHRKDLSALNRDLSRTLIVDCSEEAYSLHPKHGLCVTPYNSEQDPKKEDTQLRSLLPFLLYLGVITRMANAPALDEELGKLGVSPKLQGGGEEFAKAVQERFAELKAKGLMPQQLLQRGGRYARPAGAGSAGSGGPTLWDRLRSRRE